MATILEIQEAIRSLPSDEAWKLADWLTDYLNDEWDRQMVADLESGKFDRLIESAEADIAANRVRDLDEDLQEPALLSQAILAKEWMTEAENEAWQDL